MAQPQAKRVRQTNFSSSELSLLADEVGLHSKLLFSAFSPTVTNQTKNKKWDEIAEKLSACSSAPRTGAQCRKKWNDYKSQVKRRAIDVRRERVKTGGGAPPEPLSDVESKVVSLIPNCQIEGIIGGMETDEIPLQKTTEDNVAAVAGHAVGLEQATPPVRVESDMFTAQSHDDPVSTQSTSTQSEQVPQSKSYAVPACPVRKQKKKASSQPASDDDLSRSLIKIEEDKTSSLKEMVDIQRQLLSIRQEELKLQRETLALKQEKWLKWNSDNICPICLLSNTGKFSNES